MENDRSSFYQRMIYGFVFFSGFASLVYQVLWMKQLGLLFGNTSHAASATLAAFFGGLAAGSWFWGRRVGRSPNPLRLYALLELGIAIAAGLYFVVLGAYHQIYPVLYQSIDSRGVLLLVKFGLALVLVFPPAFCMGGTIPVIGQALIQRRSTFGSTSALLYGVNTLGAALGAGLAGFFLPLWLGFQLTCLAAMLITALVAGLAWWLSRGTTTESKNYGGATPSETGTSTPRQWALTGVCFLSGFGFLALEVLWMRMFAQVLENSVYTFAAILVIVLSCLAVGAFISSRLARLRVSPTWLLGLLVLLSGVAISATPFVFMDVTDSLQILVLKGSWFGYLALIFKSGIVTVGPPALLLGMVFPFLMKTEEASSASAGASLGRLAAVNTAGAILGSLLCGFVFLGQLGMWGTMQLIACLYLLAAIVIPVTLNGQGFALKAAAVMYLLLQLSVLNPTGLPINSVDRLRGDEEIVETWEASDCTVAVARNERGLTIKINSHYGLGSSGAFMQQKFQADIPMMIKPETESIFFLGMGTGMTAGAALDPQHTNVNRVVVCELVPEVITAAEKYMTDLDGFDGTGGLFTDPRARVLAEDGRHFLMATDETFDLVNADLFVPFRSGAGSLYTREHFESVKARLNPGGLFVQWLPLYQVTETEFNIIAKTMSSVFKQVSLWRHSFQPGEEVVALVGHPDGRPLPASTLDTLEDRKFSVAGKSYRDLMRLQLPFDPESILFFYCGNLTEAKSLFEGVPINSDDRPLIEYMAPRSYRADASERTPWFVGPRLARLVESVQELCPPDQDPLLVDRSPANRRLPLAGTAFYRARLWGVIGDEAACQSSWQRFVGEWTDR